MCSNSNISFEDYECQYLQMMQKNISRLASNSANAKTWLVTIVSAFLAIGYNIHLGYWLKLVVVPVLILWYIDSYYLNLERALRNREQYFLNIKKKTFWLGKGVSIDADIEDALFNFKPLFKRKIENEDIKLGYVKTGCMLFNISVWPVYVAMLFCVIVITVIINNWQAFI